MRRLEERYSSSRRPTSEHVAHQGRLQSPATFETPQEEVRDAEDHGKDDVVVGGGGPSPAPSWQSMPSRGSSIADEASSVIDGEIKADTTASGEDQDGSDSASSKPTKVGSNFLFVF